MALHRITSVTIGVPNVADTVGYYEEFGLAPGDDNWFTTLEGGQQLHVLHAPTRRLLEIRIACDHPGDLALAASRLTQLGVEATATQRHLAAHEAITGVRAVLEVAPRLSQSAVAPTVSYNGPGQPGRIGRASGILRTDRVRPHKLGHAVVGTTDLESTTAFFQAGLGFKVSDRVKDHAVFLRCSTDHHNLLLMNSPVTFLHHTSWQVSDIDEIGRGAAAMLDGHPERHTWGLGRHHVGSNFFWYLKDPAGIFCEYYSDMDSIPDDLDWTPEVFEGAKGLFSWGPPPPPSFLEPEDLGALMAGAHAPG